MSCLLEARFCPLLQASVRDLLHGDEAIAAVVVLWCWCCCGLGTQARAIRVPPGRGKYGAGYRGCVAASSQENQLTLTWLASSEFVHTVDQIASRLIASP